MNNDLIFTTKLQYLEWRADYVQLSAQIRNEKLWCKEYNRAYVKTPWVTNTSWADWQKRILEAMPESVRERRGKESVHNLRERAVQMLEIRKRSKMRAQEQYLRARQAQVPIPVPIVLPNQIPIAEGAPLQAAS